MNEISSTNPLPATVRVVPVSVPANDAAANTSRSGNMLPMPKTDPVTERSQSVSMAKEMRENIQAAVTQINEYTQSLQRNIQFNMDESSGRTVITVVDRQTQKVIRQIPDDVVLSLARNLKLSLPAQPRQNSQVASADDFRLLNLRA